MSRIAVLLLLTLLTGPAVAPSRADSRKPLGTLPLPVPLDQLPGPTRDAMRKVMKDPTVTAVCQPQEFVAHSDTYLWLLDHPDRTAAAWRKLGVPAIEIRPMKDGRFYWKDPDGSELVWQTVASGPSGRIWFAEGQVKPGPLLPMISVSAVAVLAHAEKARPTGDSVIRHQLEVFLHTDSRAASLVTRLIGDGAPRMARDGSEQLLMFFSQIARYAHDKPEKAKGLLADGK